MAKKSAFERLEEMLARLEATEEQEQEKEKEAPTPPAKSEDGEELAKQKAEAERAKEEKDAEAEREAERKIQELNERIAKQTRKEAELSIRKGLASSNLTDDQVDEISEYIAYDRLLDENGEVNAEAVERFTGALSSIALRTPPKGKGKTEDLSSKASGLGKYLLDPKN